MCGAVCSVTFWDWNHISSEFAPAEVSQLSLIILTVPSPPNKPGESRTVPNILHFDVQWLLNSEVFRRISLDQLQYIGVYSPVHKMTEMGSGIVT